VGFFAGNSGSWAVGGLSGLFLGFCCWATCCGLSNGTATMLCDCMAVPCWPCRGIGVCSCFARVTSVIGQ